jgi:hypothetical protein
MNQNNGFQIKEEEVYFGQTHFPRRKIQDFWAEFCERYSEDYTNKDPDVAARVNADYTDGLRRLQARILGMNTNNAGRFRKTATAKLLASLANKYNLNVEQIKRMIDKIALMNKSQSDDRAERQEFWRIVEETLAEVCGRHGISLQIAWIILDCPTELGLKTMKPEHQEAIDILRIISYNKI